MSSPNTCVSSRFQTGAGRRPGSLSKWFPHQESNLGATRTKISLGYQQPMGEWWGCGESNPGLSGKSRKLLPLSYTPMVPTTRVERALTRT